MSSTNKVVWSEGMFLRPQHFQQQDRYTEALVRRSLAGLQPFRWGFSALEINRDLLKTGKLSVDRCAGLMPDGTSFALPEDGGLPPSLELEEADAEQTVYLAMPERRPDGREFDGQSEADALTAYRSEGVQVRDVAADDGVAQIDVGQPRLRLMLEREERAGYHCLGVGRVVQVAADRTVLIDDDFIPPCLDVRVHPALIGFVSELEGMLHQRAEGLAGRVSEAGRGTAEVADFLMLQTINRIEPHVAYLAKRGPLHPEELYRYLLEIAGELATFTTEGRRPGSFSGYRQDGLRETFEPVKAALRQALSAVLEERAVQIPLDAPNRYGIRRAPITNREMLTGSLFVLAVAADVKADALRQQVPRQVKIGAVEKISQLINMALPGVGLTPLPAAPRQIPFVAGMSYFELDTTCDAWKDLANSGGFAIHVGGEFPGLDMAFWAIRQ